MSIFIGVPTRGENWYGLHVRLHDLQSELGIKPFIIAGRLSVSDTKNRLYKYFRDNATEDWLIMIDADTIPPKNILDLTKHEEAKICGGIYFKYEPQANTPMPHAYKREANGYKYITSPEYSFMEVDGVAGGCLAIHREVVNKIKAPFNMEYDEDGIQAKTDDFCFCEKAKDIGYKIYADFNVISEHIVPVPLMAQTKKIYEINRQMTNAAFNEGVKIGLRKPMTI